MRSLRATRAHPRSRGENEGGDEALFDGCGSSPLTRGKLAAIQADSLRWRLIPAHAGKTDVLVVNIG